MFLSLVALLILIAGLSEQAELAGMVFKIAPEKMPQLPMIMPPHPDPIPIPPPPRPLPILPVPLTSISVSTIVRAWAYDVTAELKYVNQLNQTIECQYVFPIADTAAVYKLEATIGGRTLRAEIRNRTEAEDIYRTAVSSGHRAALLENEAGSPDVFRIMIGNLGPNETAVVKIGYAQQIERDTETGALSVTLPVVLNPRYVPRSDFLENPAHLMENYFPNVPYVAVSQVHYTMKFNASIDMGLDGGPKITSIESGNVTDILETVIAQNNLTATVRLASDFSQDHDFRLFINVTGVNSPIVYVEPGLQDSSDDTGGTRWFSYDIAAAWFEPIGQASSGTSSDEYWLVVDRSGSMMGPKIQSAKTALTLFIKSLPMGCKFNIIGFGSTFDHLFDDGPAEYSESSVAKAVSYANTLDANFGGTEILEPFRYIYALPKNGTRRFIILLTDGEVSNTNDVINTARQNAASTRVFSVGIGEGASTALVNGVARVSGGVSEFVRDSGDRLQAKVIGLLKATRIPSAEKVKLTWTVQSGGKVAMIMPNSTLPASAFRGRQIAQFAAIERKSSGDVSGSSNLAAMSVANNGTSAPISLQIPFSIQSTKFSEANDPLPLHRLAAKARLVELTDSYHSSSNNDIKAEAIAISIATGVLCEFTAIVAVDSETRQPVNDSFGKPLFINIERPTVYDMNQMFGRSVLGAKVVAAMPSFPMAAAGPLRGMMGLPGSPGRVAMGPRGYMGPVGSSNLQSSMAMMPQFQPPAAPPMMARAPPSMKADANAPEEEDGKKRSPVPGRSNMDALIQLQKFGGSWAMSEDFAAAVGAPNVTSAATLTPTAKAAISPQISDETLATLIGLAALRRRFADKHDELVYIDDKAVNYLRQPGLGIDANAIDSLVNTIGTALNL